MPLITWWNIEGKWGGKGLHQKKNIILNIFESLFNKFVNSVEMFSFQIQQNNYSFTTKTISVETWREKDNYAKNKTQWSILKKLTGGGEPDPPYQKKKKPKLRK